HVLDRLVDDVVEADLDLLALGELAGARIGAGMEADDDRPRGRGQQHVGLADLADRVADDADLDLAGAELGERLRQRLDRSVYVALDDELELAGLALAHAGVETR